MTTTTTHPARRLRHGERPTEPRVFEDDAANKAVEEGDDAMREAVSDFRKATYEFARGQDPDDHALMLSAQRRIFETYRASRQVANKSEVDLDAGFLQWVHDRMRFVHGEHEDYDYMHKLRAIIASVPPGRNTPNVASLATPPATTVASTVLTDERIEQIWDVTETADAETLKEVRLRFARAIAREVAAQAGQVAVPEARVREMPKCIEGFAIEDGRLVSGDPDLSRLKDGTYWLCTAPIYHAPSPAKESK